MTTRRFVFIAFVATAVVFSSIAPAYGQTKPTAAQRLRSVLRNLRAQVTSTTASTPTPTPTPAPVTTTMQPCGPNVYPTPQNPCMMSSGSYASPSSGQYPSGSSGGGMTSTMDREAMITQCMSSMGKSRPDCEAMVGQHSGSSSATGGATSGTTYPSAGSGQAPSTGSTPSTSSGQAGMGSYISSAEQEYYRSSRYKDCLGSQETFNLIQTLISGDRINWSGLTGDHASRAGRCNYPGAGSTTSSTGTPNTGSTSNMTMASDSFYQCIASGSAPLSRERYNFLMSGNMSSAAEPEKKKMADCANSGGTGTYTAPSSNSGGNSWEQCLATVTSDGNKSSISLTRQQELKNSDWKNATAQEFNQRTWCEVGGGSGSGSAGGTASTGDPYLRCLETPSSDGGNRSSISRSRKAELDKNNFQNATSGEKNQMNYCTNVAGAGTGTATGGTSGQPDTFRQCVITAGMTALRLERLWSGYMHEQTTQERDIFSRCGSSSGGGGGTQPPSSGIRVTSPSGGEYWRVGEVVSISWANETRPVEVMLQSYMPPCDSKTQPCPMMSAMPMFGYVISRGASSPFQWKVGVDMNSQKIPAGTYAIQISGPSGSDWSDGPVKLYDEGGGQPWPEPTPTPGPTPTPVPAVCTQIGYVVRMVGDAIERRSVTDCEIGKLIREGWQMEQTSIGKRPPDRIIGPRPIPQPQPKPDDYPNLEMDDQEQARMLERMKRGVSSVERLVKRMDQKIVALEKRGLSLSVDSLEAMKLLREVITTVKEATEPESVFEFMAEVPELMRTINLRVRPEIELLANAPSMVTEMNRSVRSAKRQQRRLGIKAEEVASLTGIYQAAQEQLKAKDYEELRETFQDFQEELWQLRSSYPGLGESIYRFGIAPVEFPGFELNQ